MRTLKKNYKLYWMSPWVRCAMNLLCEICPKICLSIHLIVWNLLLAIDKLCFDCHLHNVILPFFPEWSTKCKVVCKFIPGLKMWFFVLEKVVKNWMNQISGNKILNIFTSLCKLKKSFLNLPSVFHPLG